MALFGFQLCLTVIMASFLQKLSPYFSLGNWILCNGSLVRFLQPSNEAMKKFAGKDANDKRNTKSNANRRKNAAKSSKETATDKPETFKISKHADIPLQVSKIMKEDVLLLRKYMDYEWLVDFSFYASLVYIITEFYFEWKDRSEINVSMIWAFLVIGFVLRNLISIMQLYFKSETGELSLCIMFGFFSFVIAMAVLVVDESILEFGLDSAYESFLRNATEILPGAEAKSAPVSLPAIKLGVALMSGAIGTLLVFPGIRTAQMYLDGLRFSRGNKLMQLLLHVNHATPLITTLLWVKPFARDVLCESSDDSASRKALLTGDQFDVVRILVVLILFFLKFLAIRIHLQAYLNLAYVKLRKLKREAGSTTNVEIQQMITRVYYYTCVVTLQYVCPILLIVFFTMALKTMGRHSWTQLTGGYNGTAEVRGEERARYSAINENSTFTEMVSQAGISLEQMSKVLTPLVFRGIFSFLVWWLCCCCFLASCVGVVYHYYLVV